MQWGSGAVGGYVGAVGGRGVEPPQKRKVKQPIIVSMWFQQSALFVRPMAGSRVIAFLGGGIRHVVGSLVGSLVVGITTKHRNRLGTRVKHSHFPNAPGKKEWNKSLGTPKA